MLHNHQPFGAPKEYQKQGGVFESHLDHANKESTSIHHAYSHRFVIELLLWQKVFKPDEDELHRPPPTVVTLIQFTMNQQLIELIYFFGGVSRNKTKAYLSVLSFLDITAPFM